MLFRLLQLAGIAQQKNDKFPPYDPALDPYPPNTAPPLEALDAVSDALQGEQWPYLLPRRRAEERFGRLVPGKYSWSHLPYSRALSEILRNYGIVMLFITRDPRDWALSATRHRLHHWSNTQFSDPRLPNGRMPTERELLPVYIFGSLPGSMNKNMRPIRMLPIEQRYGMFRPWRDDPSTLHVRFEDLVGPGGGGTLERSHDAIRQILQHIGAPATPARVRRIGARLFKPFRPTENRRGLIGAWKEHEEFFNRPDVRERIQAAAAINA